MAGALWPTQLKVLLIDGEAIYICIYNDGGDGGGGGSGAVEPEQSTMYVLQDKLRVLTLYNIYSRLGKTESLGPWRKVIVHHSKPSLCQNDPQM